jgi:hypothetical protein
MKVRTGKEGEASSGRVITDRDGLGSEPRKPPANCIDDLGRVQFGMVVAVRGPLTGARTAMREGLVIHEAIHEFRHSPMLQSPNWPRIGGRLDSRGLAPTKTRGPTSGYSGRERIEARESAVSGCASPFTDHD